MGLHQGALGCPEAGIIAFGGMAVVRDLVVFVHPVRILQRLFDDRERSSVLREVARRIASQGATLRAAEVVRQRMGLLFEPASCVTRVIAIPRKLWSTDVVGTSPSAAGPLSSTAS